MKIITLTYDWIYGSYIPESIINLSEIKYALDPQLRINQFYTRGDIMCKIELRNNHPFVHFQGFNNHV
jgi:hypothetical protein